MSVPSRRFRKSVLLFMGMKIGKDSVICKNVEIRDCQNIVVGSGCVINSKCLLDGRGGKLIIGNNVDIAQEVNIWTLEHDSHTHEAKPGEVIIGDYCWIGNRTIILPNVKIGKDSICAAGSVVTKDILPDSIVGGVPAKVIASRNRKINYKLSFDSIFR